MTEWYIPQRSLAYKDDTLGKQWPSDKPDEQTAWSSFCAMIEFFGNKLAVQRRIEIPYEPLPERLLAIAKRDIAARGWRFEIKQNGESYTMVIED